MSLQEALKTKPVDSRLRCGVADWIDTLDPEEQDAAATLLSDQTWTVAYVTQAFQDEGFSRGVSVVSRHRRGQCSCR
jgi:hypothetical protein